MRAALPVIPLLFVHLSCAGESPPGRSESAATACEASVVVETSASMPVGDGVAPPGSYSLEPDRPPPLLADQAAALAAEARADALTRAECPEEATPVVAVVAGSESLEVIDCELVYRADLEVSCRCVACDDEERDIDGDGTADCRDECPEDPDKVQPGTCGCGSSDEDADLDGTVDCEDPCPGLSPPYADRDADGAPDCRDECPDEPELTEFGPCDCRPSDSDDPGDCAPVDWCPADPCTPGPLVGPCDPITGQLCAIDPYCCTVDWDPACAEEAAALFPACAAVCGNGIVEEGEECDDGNVAAGDGCSPTCRIERCGDGSIPPPDGCDDGGGDDGGDGECSSACHGPVEGRFPGLVHPTTRTRP